MVLIANQNRGAALLAATILLTACQMPVGDTANGRTLEPTQSGDQRSEAGLRVVPLTIASDGKTHGFRVELAETPEQQAAGLMFRTELAPDAGMIFPFAEDRMANFWMKNTVIPLDIIFVRRDGTIESIAANTVPYSLAPVRSGEPVAAVLELAGGRAAELGLAPGDQVAWQE